MHKFSSMGLVLVFLVATLSFSWCEGDDGTQSQEGYPISSEIFTTRQRAIVPSVNSGPNAISPWDPSKFKENGFGLWPGGSLAGRLE